MFNPLNNRQGIARLLVGASFIWHGWLVAPAAAEDVIATASTTYRGKVMKASLTQIIMQLSDGNQLGIPRASITSIAVKPPPRVLEGMKAYQDGNMAVALQQLTGVDADYAGLDTPWVPASMIALGRAAAAEEELALAENAFRGVITAYPDGDDRRAAEVGLAGLRLAGGKTELALKAFQELAVYYDDVVKPDPAREALAAETFLGLGKSFEAKSSWAEALNAYLKVAALYPAPGFVDEALLRGAMMQLRLKKPLAAEGALLELVEDYPGSKQSARAGQLLSALRKQMAAAEQPDESNL